MAWKATLAGSSVAVAILAACLALWTSTRSSTELPAPVRARQRSALWQSRLTSHSYVKLAQAPFHVLERLFIEGQIPPESALDLREYNSIDAVWFYANGSDIRHILSQAFYHTKPVGFHLPSNLSASDDFDLILQDGRSSDPSEQEKSHRADPSSSSSPLTTSISNRFRDNGELLYSLRSAQKHLGKSLRTPYLVTTDFWASGLPVHDTDIANPSTLSTDVGYQQALSYWSENDGEFEERPGESLRSDVFRTDDGLLRYGQTPQWLNLSAVSTSADETCRSGEPGQFVLCHDWQLTQSITSMKIEHDTGSSPSQIHDSSQWKLAALPTFNSMSAEAVLSLKMENLSEAFIYSNDDMFITRDMAASDFYSPLFGPVLRMSTEDLIEDDEHPEQVIGEGPSILWSNWLLSKRFGLKKRPWFYHFQKVGSRGQSGSVRLELTGNLTELVFQTYTKLAILESRLMWADSFESAVMHRFRGDGRMANSHFLTFHYIIERHREALLWSFFVLKWQTSGQKTEYTEEDLRQIQAALGATDEHQRPVSVKMPVRRSLQMIPDQLAKSHTLQPKNTDYLFTSMDGSANIQLPFKNPDKPWPRFEEGDKGGGSEREACTLDVGSCWPIGSRDPDQVFKHFAFARPECGDCAIVHLIGQSGHVGLQAFLPKRPSRTTTRRSDEKQIAALAAFHLPLDDDWRQANFTLPSVLQSNGIADENDISPLDIALSLLHRYAYVIGDSHSLYSSLQSNEGVSELVETLHTMTETGATPALLCLNDDLGEAGEEWNVKHVTTQLRSYFEISFPDPLPYERRMLGEDEEDPDEV